MTPHDDPEDRIRELEGARNAQYSELTTSPSEIGYGAAPPTRVDPAPPSPSGTNWVVWGVVAGAVGAISVGAVALFGAMLPDPPGEVRGVPTVSIPNVSGGGGPFDAPSTGGNRPAGPVAEPTEELASPGTVVSVSGVREQKTVACADGDVRISGVSNTVVITGACASVTVSGIENVVTVDSSVTISVSGMDNRVTFLSGAPEIDESGGGNVVTPG